MVRPSFWIGETGRFLRAAGPDVLLVAQYLMTCPSSNMIGLYHLSLPTLAHDTGLTLEGARKALRRASEGDFAHYDEGQEVVWVVEMARYQIADHLSPRDNRVKAIGRELDLYRKSSFFLPFLARYAAVFHLPDPSPLQAPCKPLRSQEQEQEQEQDHEQEIVLRSKGSGNSKDNTRGEGLGGATDAPLRLPPKTGTQIELVPDCQPAKARKRPTAARPAPAKGSAGLDLPPWLSRSSWSDWCAFRQKKSGKGWTDRAAELSLRKLAALRDQGHDPTAVIEQSIERGWTGLFELKDAGSTKEQRYYSDVDEDPPRRATTTEGPSGIASIVADLFEEST